MAFKAGQVSGGSTFAQVDMLLSSLTQYSGMSISGTSIIRTPSDPKYRVGVEVTDVPHFRDTGFKPEYRDPNPGSENQVRHFVAFLYAGKYFGQIAGGISVFLNEYPDLDVTSPDYLLGFKAAVIGANTNTFTNDGLSQLIWSEVCGQSTPLSLPR